MPSINLSIIKDNLFIVLFFILASLYLYASILDNTQLMIILKPLAITSLIIQYIMSVKKVNTMYIMALCFAMLGSILFKIDSETNHMNGLSAFFIYTSLNTIIVSEKIGQSKFNKILLALIPFAVILFLAIFFLFKNMGYMKILIIINGMSIAIFGAFCLYFYTKTFSKMALFFLLAAIFYMAASILKAIKLFIDNSFFYKVLTTFSYILSLFFIYRALLINNLKKKEVEFKWLRDFNIN